MVTHLPPLAPLNYPQAKCIGDVFIHPHAVIAAGVLLWAEPGSRLEIGAGACIGMGTILHASHGALIIATGASLGAGVLFIGSGEIGPQACVGASTTIINTSVAAGVVIPPGSLLGDTSRQVPILEDQSPPEDVEVTPQATPEAPAQTPASVFTPELDGVDMPEPEIPEPSTPKPVTEKMGLEPKTTAPISETTIKAVYGQSYVNQMLNQMFNRPHQA